MPSKRKSAENRRRDPDRRALIRRLIATGISAVILALCSIVNAVAPFRTLLSAIAMPPREEGEARIHFLSVGEGDCTVVEFSDGRALVVDAGDGSVGNAAKLSRYLRGLGSPPLTLVATHGDTDHCGGMKDIIEEFGAEKLYLPVVPEENEAYAAMLAAAEAASVPTEPLARYGAIAGARGEYAVCLSPYSQGETGGNDGSAVLYLDLGGVRAVLTADIGAARERRLTEEYALFRGIFDSGDRKVRLEGVDFLKVAHHGSAYSSSAEWLALLDAKVGVISSGRDNPYGHPAGAAVERLAASVGELYRTDELGDVVAVIADGTFTVRTDFTL